MLPFFLLLAAHVLRSQEPVCALFQGNTTPDSIVRITTVLPGTTQPQTLTVAVTDGWASIEGDIVLGRIEELQAMAQDRGVVREATQFRWPNGTIPFIINAGFTSQYITLLRQSMEYVNGATHLYLRPFVSGDTRWVVFNPSTVCDSQVGMQSSGGQLVNLKDPFAPGNNGTGCGFRAIVHEIGHAAGLWHEQSREDRNSHVTINWANIIPGKEHNFDQHITDGTDIWLYDFESVMHYGPFDFSVNGLPTITAINGEPFGNATEYSPVDVLALKWLYPIKPCPPFYIPGADLRPVVQPLHFEVSSAIGNSLLGNFVAHNIPAGTQVIYDAGQSIYLSPGFHARLGCTFRAVIDGCGGAVQSLTTPNQEEWLLEAENNQQHLNVQESSSVGATGKPALASSPFNVSPNPFSGSTTFSYTLAATQEVEATVFNSTGTLVAKPLPRQTQVAGEYRYTFEAGPLPNGIYWLVFQKDGERVTRRIVLTPQ